ncbi:helix-turn-helix domain-containing protein [Leifsonia aquatica]|uniref:helix-turn-helix domain-containing protein n=1 Tax=Leifsonia aquatica TaxID=144185 RepID=UPI00046836A0|nr:helix-turn-helix domain-containing protein [Leifsonia aquatica]
MTRNLADPNDTWWTIDQTADHFDIKRRTVMDWIRAGDLTVYGNTKLIRRTDALAVFRARRKQQRETRFDRGC